MSQIKPSLLKIYWILMKPRVVFLLQVTALCGIFTYDFREGYDSGRTYIDSLETSIIVLLGGTMASGGSMAVNMWYERDIDPLMERTENRPIQSGFISANHALLFGITISLTGIILVSFLTNISAGIITGLSAVFYTVIYTMVLKRRTPQNIVIGGLAGSTPPAIGWVAASNEINELLPWLMVVTIFLWTPAHFWALTLSKRKDYGEAGVPMLPVIRGEDVTRKYILGYCLCLVINSVLIVILGNTGLIFITLGTALSLYFAYLSYNLTKTKSSDDAWALFKFSNAYLFILFIILVFDTAYSV
ncbi:MAG: protoheme IX farnesyltransferase [Marine Group III euryarchaeote CG-Epi3]|jgi:protoheme IX farnesyltransferase|uniref:Protoheme IX farnesyltransferase n=1 Tax=Marine Group III euryarchaeote CG-Epi3 TaxID=1888997 RepID=A0A1J5UG63_9ARCH|nr:MAG: protoheme IX farnesyltransferase [Marine Group III euryarchaeote CG-Epi3]|tara:strand:- start:18120 stop:19028 length:909 start_codon:yes stop_codon:yes gene_type:complete